MMGKVVETKTGGDKVAWCALTADAVVKRLETDAKDGLSTEAAMQRLLEYGTNRLPQGKKQSQLMRFLLQFNNILVYVLLGAGFVKMMVGLWLDAGIILGVVVINSLLGFLQEGKAEKALDSISNMLSSEARTVRGGIIRVIPADELVPGDIVLLESGDKVPADLRLVDVKNLCTEEAPLTGESVPIDKSTDAVSAKATIGDREGMAFSGTLVVSGRGTGVVVATGANTELGRINQMMASVSVLETPLLRQIKKFGYIITAVIGVVGVLCSATTPITWIYADHLKADPERRHKVKGRTSFAFSDVRRLIAEAALNDDFDRVCPKPGKPTKNSLVAVLLRRVA